MKDKEFNGWAKTRQKSQKRFILINGLLGWGLPMFVIMTFVVNDAFDDEGLKIPLVLFSIGLWSLGGLAFGKAVWFFSEQRYQKELKKRSEA